MKRSLPIAFAFVGLVACSSDSNTTTGKRITLHTTARGDATAKTTFTTGFGWDVTLTKAAVSTAGLYYFDGPPPTALWKAPPKKKGWSDYFIGSAWAHPGHYQAGTALGQVVLTAPITIDVLGAEVALPDGDGITGTYRSARFVLPQAPAGTDPILGTHVALAEGKAVLHGAAPADPDAGAGEGGASAGPIYFRLVADFADISASIQNGAVDGCVLDEAVVTDNGAIDVEVIPRVWLNLVDFSKIAKGTEAAPTEARDAGFSQGVTQLSAYHFTYTKQP